MQYGACSWVFGDSPLPEVAEGLARLGYDGIELLGDWSLCPSSEARRILADHGLVVFSLTPKNVDLAHPDAGVRLEALDYYFHLLEFAAGLGAPAISCHGAVGRCRALATQAKEEAWFSEGIARIADRAERGALRVALEPLNRYESHLLATAAQGRALADRIGSPAVGLLLDAYHMNIEEADLVAALRAAGEKLVLFHAADSNRRAVGRGHVPFPSLFRALAVLGYGGPVIVECTPPGLDPFVPGKGKAGQKAAWEEVASSLRTLRFLEKSLGEEGVGELYIAP